MSGSGCHPGFSGRQEGEQFGRSRVTLWDTSPMVSAPEITPPAPLPLNGGGALAAGRDRQRGSVRPRATAVRVWVGARLAGTLNPEVTNMDAKGEQMAFVYTTYIKASGAGLAGPNRPRPDEALLAAPTGRSQSVSFRLAEGLEL